MHLPVRNSGVFQKKNSSGWSAAAEPSDHLRVRGDLRVGSFEWSPVVESRFGRAARRATRVTDRGIVLPMASGELQILSPDDGKFQEASEAGSTRLLEAGSTNGREHRLGNLITVAGRIVSTSNLDLLTFEWKSEVARWEAESKTSLPAALRQAQSLAFAGQTDEAAKLLRESILSGRAGRRTARTPACDPVLGS